MTAQATHVASPSRRGGDREGLQARDEVLDTLREDHRIVEAVLQSLERLQRAGDYEGCELLAHETYMELMLHARLEEDVFYPALRHVVAPAQSIDEAEAAHHTTRILIDQLRGMRADEPRFAATFGALGDCVRQHMHKEEDTLFRKLMRAPLDWEQLLEDLQEQREVLMGELSEEAGLALAMSSFASAMGSVRRGHLKNNTRQ